jgi:U3 small nucleolar RNA-associated protein 13
VDGLCSLVACGCADGFIRVYDYARNFATHALRGHDGPITALLFNSFALPVHGSTIPPHRSFWSGGVDGTVRLWNTVSKKCLISEEVHLAAVASLCLRF